MKTFFTKSKEGFKIKVGTLALDENKGKYVFEKHKPHYMRVLNGYGIQKDLVDEKGKKYDIQDIFRTNKNIEIIINDNGLTYTSTAEDWLRHLHTANYGDGRQVFLSLDYMNK